MRGPSLRLVRTFDDELYDRSELAQPTESTTASASAAAPPAGAAAAGSTSVATAIVDDEWTAGSRAAPPAVAAAANGGVGQSAATAVDIDDLSDAVPEWSGTGVALPEHDEGDCGRGALPGVPGGRYGRKVVRPSPWVSTQNRPLRTPRRSE